MNWKKFSETHQNNQKLPESLQSDVLNFFNTSSERVLAKRWTTKRRCEMWDVRCAQVVAHRSKDALPALLASVCTSPDALLSMMHCNASTFQSFFMLQNEREVFYPWYCACSILPAFHRHPWLYHCRRRYQLHFCDSLHLLHLIQPHHPCHLSHPCHPCHPQCVNKGWCSPILTLVYFSSNTHFFSFIYF